ncbi:MAG: ABC transporter ATP-binding protein [Eubacteriales bacterium]|nr:ABC transporter ATP-binding protein [Eubacteriales bacterium]
MMYLKGFFRPAWPLLLCSLLCVAAVAGADISLPFIIGRTIDAIGSANQEGVLFRGVLLLLITAGLRTVAAAAAVRLQQRSLNAFISRVRMAAHEHLLHMDLSTVLQMGKGHFLTRLIQDPETMGTVLLQGVSVFFRGLLTVAGTLVVLFVVRPTAAVMLSCFIPFILIITLFIAKNAYRYFQKTAELRAEMSDFIEEIFSTRTEQAVCDRDGVNRQHLHGITDRMVDAGVRGQFFAALPNPATRFLNAVIYTVVAVYCAFGVADGSLSVGWMLALLKYTGQFIAPFYDLTAMITQWQSAVVCARRIEDFFALPADALYDSVPVQPVEKQSAAPLLQLDKVSFSYSGAPFQMYVDRQVRTGEKIVLAGPTGGGKTTLLHLITGLYRPTGGRILLNGRDVRNLSSDERRKPFCAVLQDSFLRRGTVAENIAYGTGVTDRDRIIEAARNACAHPFIMRLPQGYDTPVTEGGANLSRGERQFIGIARAMLLSADILLLDEATSDMDADHALRISEAFDRLAEGKTVFVAAHRLATVRSADEIWVIQDGKVVEAGTHEVLSAAQGLYHGLLTGDGGRSDYGSV